MHANTLARLVAAENHHGKIANQFLPTVFDSVKAFLNQKIILATGGPSKAFRDAVVLPGQRSGTAAGSYIFYFDSSSYTVSVMLRTGFPIGDRWETVERRYYLADISGGVMTKSHEYVKQAETWDFGVVQGRLFQIEALKNQISQIKMTLPERVQEEERI